MNKIKETILKALKQDDRLWNEEKTELNQTLLLDLIDKIDEKIIELLLQEEELREKFFVKIKNAYVFKTSDFQLFMEENKVDNSYTAYKNRIGLTDGKKFLKDTNDVVLNFPYKDCVLEGGQSTEEGNDTYFQYSEKAGKYEEKKAKRKEIFFNQVLAKDEIDRLEDSKALINWKRFTKDGEQEVKEIKRDEDGTIKENLIIKGNNLLALHSLKKQFSGKVKLIYIDPPYNTGNDDFKYNDNFNHSTWLTFMKNRLEIAKVLLKDDGVIFVQCDDNEQAYLKVLMDELYGRANFITTVTVVSDARTRNYEALSKTHEFFCVYSKTSNYKMYQFIDKDKKFSYKDNEGGFDIYELRNRNIAFNSKNRPNLFYSFYLNPRNKDQNGFYEISLTKRDDWIEVLPLKSNNVQTVWRWGKEKAKKNLNTVLFGKSATNGYQIIKKYREQTKPFSTVWNEKEILTDRGTLQIKALFNQKLFDFPKPEEFIAKIINLATKEGDLVLDFFAGSGTTGAVAHKMNRQYLLIEQMDYIHDLPEARLKKVIAGEQGGISKSVNWKGGGDFIYFELAKWNEKAKEEITKCKSLDELKGLFDSLYENYFLNYNLKIKDFREKVVKEEEFKALSLEEQKRMFLTMLDLNQMYVQESEMADKRFGISEKDRKLTSAFYNNEQ